MKKILIVLVMMLVISLWGEEEYTYKLFYSFPPCNEPVKTIVGNDSLTTIINPYQVIVLFTLLQYYAEYEQECYNDSISVEIDSIIVKYSFPDYPTFDGFIKFIRDKIKEK